MDGDLLKERIYPDGLYQKDEAILESIRVKGGVADSVIIKSAPFACVVNKSDVKKVEEYFEIPESIEAPFDAGGIIGNIKFTIGDTPIGYTPIYTSQPVQRIGFWQLFLKMIKNILN